MLCLPSVDALKELRPKGVSPVVVMSPEKLILRELCPGAGGGGSISPAVSKLPESSVPSVGGGLKDII